MTPYLMRRHQSIYEALGSLNTTHCVLRIDVSSDQNLVITPSRPSTVVPLLLGFCVILRGFVLL